LKTVGANANYHSTVKKVKKCSSGSFAFYLYITLPADKSLRIKINQKVLHQRLKPGIKIPAATLEIRNASV
jgi:hypothetical protein